VNSKEIIKILFTEPYHLRPPIHEHPYSPALSTRCPADYLDNPSLVPSLLLVGYEVMSDLVQFENVKFALKQPKPCFLGEISCEGGGKSLQ